MAKSRFKRLFAIAKDLGMGLEELRLGTPKGSLSKLTKKQLRDYEKTLQQRKDKVFNSKRAKIAREFENEQLTPVQIDYLLDLIADIFPGIKPFRSWLSHYMGISHERFMNNEICKRTIKALQEMRARSYRI